MKHREFWLIATLAAALAVAGLIFFFSSQKGEESDALGLEVVEPAVRALRPGYDAMPATARQNLLSRVITVVRKLAHFCEFALLGFCLAAHLRVRFLARPIRSVVPPAWIIATLYAGTDELHQMFVSDRSPELRDVGIDSAGALCGALLMALLLSLLERWLARRGRA